MPRAWPAPLFVQPPRPLKRFASLEQDQVRMQFLCSPITLPGIGAQARRITSLNSTSDSRSGTSRDWSWLGKIEAILSVAIS